MEQPIVYVGLGLHKDTIAVALAEASLQEVREHGKGRVPARGVRAVGRFSNPRNLWRVSAWCRLSVIWRGKSFCVPIDSLSTRAAAHAATTKAVPTE